MEMKNRVGEIRKGNSGLMKIIEYNDASDIKVKFKTGNIIKTRYEHFKSGIIKDPLFASVWGVGCIGIGKYKPSINRKDTIEYHRWTSMLWRCYDPYFLNKHQTYKDMAVCNEWLNFQNFAEWFQDNYYKLHNERVELDKDIIKKGNKIYCPEYCALVPRSINTLITKGDKIRGAYPIGVWFNKQNNKYGAKLHVADGKRKFLGYFSTPKKAFIAYKTAKEKYIKIMANKYKEILNNNVYKSLMQYQVEITD